MKTDLVGFSGLVSVMPRLMAENRQKGHIRPQSLILKDQIGQFGDQHQANAANRGQNARIGSRPQFLMVKNWPVKTRQTIGFTLVHMKCCHILSLHARTQVQEDEAITSAQKCNDTGLFLCIDTD